MSKITKDSVVEASYTLTNADGEVLDQSDAKNPLTFIQGKQSIIPLLESEMLNKEVGTSFTLTVPPENAYGHRNEEMIQVIPKEHFGADTSSLEVGMQFEVQADNNQKLIAVVQDVKENEVVLDANHPLAGETLYFSVKILTVRSATNEELKNGLEKAEASSCECC